VRPARPSVSRICKWDNKKDISMGYLDWIYMRITKDICGYYQDIIHGYLEKYLPGYETWINKDVLGNIWDNID
jgi:hypothetical protein